METTIRIVHEFPGNATYRRLFQCVWEGRLHIIRAADPWEAAAVLVPQGSPQSIVEIRRHVVEIDLSGPAAVIAEHF